MYNISKDTLSRVSARNRNRTSYAEVIDGLEYTFPFTRGDIVYFSKGNDPERSRLFPKIVVEVGVPVKTGDGTYVEGMRVKHSDGFEYVPGYQETVKVASHTKYTQEELDNFEGVIG
jgi:hypothetical protein